MHGPIAPYDLVGQYNQDEINGFDPDLIDRMLQSCRLEQARSVLDGMAGDGNLTQRLLRFCDTRGIPRPKVTLLEYSRVQSELAEQALRGNPVEVIWGDILAMQSLANSAGLPRSAYDRVVIKSANHEIPAAKQAQLYKSIYEVLVPDGLYVNLGFVFDDEQERDELREIARVKDSLAGLREMVENRHFLTRGEFYDRLRRAGFVDIETVHAFSYRIRSEIVARRYFKTEVLERDNLEFQIAQLRAATMRRKGRIRFEADATVMECPGEITVARRPTLAEENQAIYKRYPYDFLRHIKAHRELLARAVQFVEPGARVLDAGCGIGLMAEKAAARSSHYLAVDINPQFVEICSTRMRSLPQVEAVLGDLNNFAVASSVFDCAFALNVVYQEDINPPKVLAMLRDALRPGGILVFSAPKCAESFENCREQMFRDLDQEGALSAKDEIAEQITAANARLLTSNAHYWSAAEMTMLLRDMGFSEIADVDETLYYGNAWLIAAVR